MASRHSYPANTVISDSEKEEDNLGHEVIKELIDAVQESSDPIGATSGEGDLPILNDEDEEEWGKEWDRKWGVKREEIAGDLPWTREKRLAEIEVMSKSKGGLEAIRAMFLKLERMGVGTTRSEEIARDITYQNVLKSVDKEAKLKPKSEQPRSVRTVRTILRAMREQVEGNILEVKELIKGHIIQVVLSEGKMENGDRQRKLVAVSNRLENLRYNQKWESELEDKVAYLVEKYGETMTEEEHEALTGIKWRDEDLKNIEQVEKATNVVIIGDINPPLTEEEIEVIAMDPKFCTESNVTIESIKVSLSEAKVKRIWSELSKPVVEEGEDPPTPEEIEQDQQLEDDMRRIYKPRSLIIAGKE